MLAPSHLPRNFLQCLPDPLSIVSQCQFLCPAPLIHGMMKDLITAKNCDILGFLFLPVAYRY